MLVTSYVYCTLTEVFRNLTEVFLTLTEVFPCFFLSCKANARVKLAKTGHGPHSSTLVVICVVRLLFVLLCVLFVCKCVQPPGDNPTAVSKYIISLYTTSTTVLWTVSVVICLFSGRSVIAVKIQHYLRPSVYDKHPLLWPGLVIRILVYSYPRGT